MLCCSSQLEWDCLAVCAAFVPHLPTGNVHVTSEPEVAWQWSTSPRAVQDADFYHSNATESTWILSWCSGDQLGQLMMSNTRSSRVVVRFSIGLQVAVATCAILSRALEARSHPHSGPQQRADWREWRLEESACEVFNAQELEYRSWKISLGS